MADRVGAEPLVPTGWRLRPDAATRRARGGTVVFGGTPLRVLRLSAAGAAVVDAWWRGAPVGDRVAERRLARRLLAAGLAHPDPPAAGDPATVTVVVPVHDRPDELRRCLASIDPRCPVIVVDDGSGDAGAVAAIAREADALLHRLDPGVGAPGARNAGLGRVQTPFVAFVDSDCVLGPAFPGRLLDHLADPPVAVAVPRIVGLATGERGMLVRYEAHHSALDMGPRAGLVRAGSSIPYAPSAALVARVAALGDGFADDLPMGEDVDLLWRLGDAGWQVRYDPAVTIAHDHRVAWLPWFRRRIAYNESNALLERRHPGKVPALAISGSSAALWAAAAAGAPAAAVAISLARVAALARVLRRHVPGAPRVAARLVVGGQLHEGRQLARALTGPWLPLLLAATVARPRAMRRLWLGILAAGVWEWAQDRGQPTPLHHLAPKAAEDVARCLGVWRGCLRTRRFGALLPQLALRRLRRRA
jgi:mycofactocin system glycosyltransferase